MPKGELTSKDTLSRCEAIQIVHHAGLLALVGGNANGNGAVAKGHDSSQQGDNAELVEVGELQGEIPEIMLNDGTRLQIGHSSTRQRG